MNKRDATLTRCTYAHAWVFPQIPEDHTLEEMKEMTKKFTAVLQRNHDQVAIDADFDGHFYLDNFADVNSHGFIKKVSQYFVMAKHRQLCRINGKIEDRPEIVDDYDQPLTELEALTTEEYIEDEQETDFLAELLSEDFSDLEMGTDLFDGVLFSETESSDAEEEEVVNTEMSCCGAGANVMPYDRLTKHCCQTDPLGLETTVQQTICGI